jgi:hypothetical protein
VVRTRDALQGVQEQSLDCDHSTSSQRAHMARAFRPNLPPTRHPCPKMYLAREPVRKRKVGRELRKAEAKVRGILTHIDAHGTQIVLPVRSVKSN